MYGHVLTVQARRQEQKRDEDGQIDIKSLVVFERADFEAKVTPLTERIYTDRGVM
jgi:hypothetical protein